jgi:hypothetical protein
MSDHANPVSFTRMGLYIGNRFTGVSLEPDAVYPQMWRIRRGDQWSDMVNLMRAKEAAISWARPRGLGGAETVSWHNRERRGRGGPHCAKGLPRYPSR